MSPRSILPILALALLSASVVQANVYNSPLKTAIDQSVQEAISSEPLRGRPRPRIADPERLIANSRRSLP